MGGGVTLHLVYSEKEKFVLINKNKGRFYQVSGIDAYIFNVLFEYKVTKGRVGFPECALDKVCDTLKYYHLSFQVHYENKQKEDIIVDFGEKNTYSLYTFKAKGRISDEEKLEQIFDTIKNLDEEETKTFISEIEALLGTKYESHR